MHYILPCVYEPSDLVDTLRCNNLLVYSVCSVGTGEDCLVDLASPVAPHSWSMVAEQYHFLSFPVFPGAVSDLLPVLLRVFPVVDFGRVVAVPLKYLPRLLRLQRSLKLRRI